MALTKTNDDSVLPATGSRTLSTVANADGTYTLGYHAIDTAGQPHDAAFESTTAGAWITNAIANPGTNADIDALMTANPNFTAAYLAVARAMLFIYADQVALGFTET